MTPEHLHLVLNHLPLFCLLAALVPLAVGGYRKSQELVLVGLAMGLVFGAATPIVVLSGERAEDRLEASLDHAGRTWLDVHEERAEVAAPIVYGVMALCLASAIAVVKRNSWLRPVTIASAAGILVAVGVLGWVAQAGGKVRHPEIRPPSGQALPPQTGDHEQ